MSCGDELEPGGFVTDYDLELHAPLQVKVNGTWAAAFSTQPGLGAQIGISGVSYTVGRGPVQSPNGLELVLG